MLEYLKPMGVNEKKYKVALYKCECGKEVIWPISEVKRGRIVSCGCYKKNRLGNKARTHGLTKHPLYSVWTAIIQRCEDPNVINYDRYGGRGVKICKEWRNDFKSFYDWAIVNGWKKGLQIDKDKNGDGLLYSPQTCCVLTPDENNKYKRNNRNITYKNETLSFNEMAKKYDLLPSTLNTRITNGWDIEKALTTPLNTKKLKHILRIYRQVSINHSFGYIK